HEWGGFINRQSGPDEHSGRPTRAADRRRQPGQRCGLLNLQLLSRRPNRVLCGEEGVAAKRSGESFSLHHLTFFIDRLLDLFRVASSHFVDRSLDRKAPMKNDKYEMMIGKPGASQITPFPAASSHSASRAE